MQPPRTNQPPVSSGLQQMQQLLQHSLRSLDSNTVISPPFSLCPPQPHPSFVVTTAISLPLPTEKYYRQHLYYHRKCQENLGSSGTTIESAQKT
ncbi:hypothetical protein BHE74_00036371 [Ensete ventricosum]|nr:hypothetical protein BHE74_00036371 [Ensete ventricosum]RZR77323.1 hypothetical protein BHM03_00002363 [Ensete ventricosum]